MTFDLLLTGGRLLTDGEPGTGPSSGGDSGPRSPRLSRAKPARWTAAGRTADVAVRDGRIVAVGRTCHATRAGWWTSPDA